MKSDTIAAIATAVSDSGIGIIRISGEEAITIANQVYHSKNNQKQLTDVRSHTIHYGYLYDEEELIDEVMVAVMRAPNTYTREDTVEIDCHGGILVMNRVLDVVLKNGCRLAEAGEFTKRAFLNGRIDLSKAEAVMDIIHSKNELALKTSVKQLRGAVSDKVSSLRGKILYEIAFIESALDDPEHISLDGYRDTLREKASNIRDELKKLIDSADSGKVLKNGIDTVIVGKPNAGKSSLLNLLVGEERAIVTSVAGTTRDVLEESVKLHGVGLNIIDTAGIRNTEDEIEKIGVEKARKYASSADLIIYMVDASCPLDENDDEIIKLIADKKVIVLLNKTDLIQVVSEGDILQKMTQVSQNKMTLMSDVKNIDSEENKKMTQMSQNNNEYKMLINGGLNSSVNEEVTQMSQKNSVVIKKKLTQVSEIYHEISQNKMTEMSEIDGKISGKKEAEMPEKNSNSNIEGEKQKRLSIIKTSTKENTGIDVFEETIKQLFFGGKIAVNDEVYITNQRHKEALTEAYESMEMVLKSLADNMPEDFYSIDLMSAYAALGRIIGEEVGESLVNEIFSRFCMGK